MKIFYACLIGLLLSNSAWGARINVAAKSNGGLASASSSYAGGIYPVEAINNGDHRGINLGGGSAWVWADGTANQYPDWAQITFNSLKTIDEIDVFTMQDNYASPIEPTATMTFNAYGLTAYDVQYWNGTTWVTVPGGSISNNNLVWRKINFPAITTDRIRVLVNAALADYSRVVEVEAYSVSNIPPTASLSVPLNTYYAPASINLTANSSDSDGTVTRVEFYNGTTLLSTATATPYSYTWTNVPTGSYTLTAKAYDNANASTTSSPVNFIVFPVTTSAINVFYIYPDHLNTPRVITDTTNKTVWRWDSDPFGTSAPFEDPDGDSIKFTYNLRFPGQYFDRETGLHYNYFRDYDPSTGRYVQSDPIGLAGGINTYAYVGGNPVSRKDPRGLDFAGGWEPSGPIGGDPIVWGRTYPPAAVPSNWENEFGYTCNDPNPLECGIGGGSGNILAGGVGAIGASTGVKACIAAAKNPDPCKNPIIRAALSASICAGNPPDEFLEDLARIDRIRRASQTIGQKKIGNQNQRP